MSDALLIRWLRQQEKIARQKTTQLHGRDLAGYYLGRAHGYAQTITYLQRRKQVKKAKAA